MAEVGRMKRKRAQRHDDGDENSDESRKRGRPRVEKPDESAADRRRTQIRMAQRAYRQRKESTLEHLRRRLAEVSGAVEAADKAFQECRGRMMASGLSKSNLDDLHTISRHVEQLTEVVQTGEEVNLVTTTIPTPPSSLKSQDGVDDVESIKMGVHEWTHQIDPVHTPPNPELVTANAACSTLPPNTTHGTLEMNDPRYIQGTERGTMQCTEALSLDRSRSMTPDSIRLTASLTPPRSYSFLETSFARRLHRMGLEAGYDLLLKRATRPKCYERIFQLSLMGRTREKLIASIRSILDRGPQESLDFWEAPLIHVGGAGTHYPRQNQFGEIQPKKTPRYIGLVGPQTLTTLENAARDNLSTDMTVEIAGFEGEWLDPYDVAGYLESKGIHIEPWASVTMVEVTEWPSHSGMILPAGPPPKFSTPDRSSTFDVVQLQMLGNINSDVRRWNDLAPSTYCGIGTSHATTQSWLHFPEPQFSSGTAQSALDGRVQICYPGVMPITTDVCDRGPMLYPSTGQTNPIPFYSPRRRIVYVDVMKFIKTLIISTVCLGRTPGYRRRDVDRALAMASFDVDT